MATFIALYRGDTVSSAKLVATSADPRIVDELAARLLGLDDASEDHVLRSVNEGRRQALRLIRAETTDALLD